MVIEMNRNINVHILTGIIIVGIAAAVIGADIPDIVLPAPRTDGGKPLMQALKMRQSGRVFSTRKIPDQTLSDLLWAAFGINRSDADKRTAPSARNWQEIEMYVVMEKGAYLYDAKANTLKLVVKGDLRGQTGPQPFVATAPLNLVFVADEAKMGDATPPDEVRLYAAADVGFISQNVYLYCASEGLSTVVRGMVNRDACAKALRLSGKKQIVLAQTVGYPGNKEK